MPTAGGLEKSIVNGREIGCTAVQVFTRSPRQWNAPPLGPEATARFRQAVAETKMGFTVAHDSYLINLAAPDSVVLERSRAAFRDELERADVLGIPWVVTHMGAHLTSCEEDSMAVLCESMNLIVQQTQGLSTGIALETTAGQGTCLGRTFEQIAQVVDGCKSHPRVGVCLDTCHIFAAGYEIRSEEAYEETISSFGRIIGFDKLKVILANDSKKPLGSRVDRHEHVGDGEIGIEPFRRVVNDPRLSHAPMIVETPDADTMHKVNVERLRNLVNGSPGKEGSSMITVTVHLFGHYKDVNPESFDMRIPASSTVSQLAQALVSAEPKLSGIERICRAAVNEEYAVNSQPLREGDTVAFIPPMSGG